MRDPDENVWPVEDSGFRRMVPGPDEEKPYLDGHVRILAVELYHEGMILTWYAHGVSEEQRQEILGRPEVREELEQVARRERDRPDVPEHTRDRTITLAQRMVLDRLLFPTGATAVDDHGNAYRWRSCSKSGQIGVRGTVYLVPGLAPDARRLTVTLGTVQFNLDV